MGTASGSGMAGGRGRLRPLAGRRCCARRAGTVLRTSRPATAVEAEFTSVMWGSGACGPSAREDATLPNGALGEVYSSVTWVGALT